MVREETWEAFVADSLLYAKIFLIAVSLIMDYRVAIWFSIIFSVLYLLAQQPAFSKLGTAAKLTPRQLEDLLSDGNTTKYCNVWNIFCRWNVSASQVHNV